jgi:hypothetical protein
MSLLRFKDELTVLVSQLSTTAFHIERDGKILESEICNSSKFSQTDFSESFSENQGLHI